MIGVEASDDVLKPPADDQERCDRIPIPIRWDEGGDANSKVGDLPWPAKR